MKRASSPKTASRGRIGQGGVTHSKSAIRLALLQGHQKNIDIFNQGLVSWKPAEVSQTSLGTK